MDYKADKTERTRILKMSAWHQGDWSLSTICNSSVGTTFFLEHCVQYSLVVCWFRMRNVYMHTCPGNFTTHNVFMAAPWVTTATWLLELPCMFMYRSCHRHTFYPVVTPVRNLQSWWGISPGLNLTGKSLSWLAKSQTNNRQYHLCIIIHLAGL